jgi:hypothetical protein
MFLQMIAFLFFLIFIGGIISLAAVVDPNHKRSAPHAGFPLLFAGICALVLSFSVAGLGEAISWLNQLDWFGFLEGYVIGLVGGGLLGYCLALRHKWHLFQSYGPTSDPGEGDAS